MYSIIGGVCVVIFFSGITIAESNYPSDLPKCHTGDNKCITEVVQGFAKNHSDGISSINLPSLEPLFIVKFDMIREEKKSFLKIATLPILEHINWRNRNVKLYGLKNATFTITGFEKNLPDSNVIITILLPNATIISDYNLNITFMQRNTHGEGKYRFEYEHLELRMNFKLKIYEKDDGKQYMKIDQPNADYTVQNVADLDFGTLFDGNELLSRLEHVFLNKNGKLLIDIVNAEAGPELARTLTEIIEPIFNEFSINQLFLNDK